ncbi:hypothetical protein NMY22_g17263 [Coprinellus aureogranulatus]|nr:hypothetical protein NMY22_g17263 [Coprinellus aureogranulatus]
MAPIPLDIETGVPPYRHVHPKSRLQRDCAQSLLLRLDVNVTIPQSPKFSGAYLQWNVSLMPRLSLCLRFRSSISRGFPKSSLPFAVTFVWIDAWSAVSELKQSTLLPKFLSFALVASAAIQRRGSALDFMYDMTGRWHDYYTPWRTPSPEFSFKLSLPLMVAPSDPDLFKIVSPIVDALNDLINTCHIPSLPEEPGFWERRFREKVVRVIETYGETLVNLALEDELRTFPAFNNVKLVMGYVVQLGARLRNQAALSLLDSLHDAPDAPPDYLFWPSNRDKVPAFPPVELLTVARPPASVPSSPVRSRAASRIPVTSTRAATRPPAEVIDISSGSPSPPAPATRPRVLVKKEVATPSRPEVPKTPPPEAPKTLMKIPSLAQRTLAQRLAAPAVSAVSTSPWFTRSSGGLTQAASSAQASSEVRRQALLDDMMFGEAGEEEDIDMSDPHESPIPGPGGPSRAVCASTEVVRSSVSPEVEAPPQKKGKRAAGSSEPPASAHKRFRVEDYEITPAPAPTDQEEDRAPHLISSAVPSTLPTSLDVAELKEAIDRLVPIALDVDDARLFDVFDPEEDPNLFGRRPCLQCTEFPQKCRVTIDKSKKTADKDYSDAEEEEELSKDRACDPCRTSRHPCSYNRHRPQKVPLILDSVASRSVSYLTGLTSVIRLKELLNEFDQAHAAYKLLGPAYYAQYLQLLC